MSKAPEQPEGSARHAVSPAAWDSLTDAQKMAVAGEVAGGIGGAGGGQAVGPVVVVRRVGRAKGKDFVRGEGEGEGEGEVAAQTRDEGFGAFVWRRLGEWLCGVSWR